MTHVITDAAGRRIASAEESTAYLRDCAARADADALRFAVADSEHWPSQTHVVSRTTYLSTEASAVKRRSAHARRVDRHDTRGKLPVSSFFSLSEAAEITRCSVPEVYNSLCRGYAVHKRWKFSEPGCEPVEAVRAHNRKREGAAA